MLDTTCKSIDVVPLIMPVTYERVAPTISRVIGYLLHNSTVAEQLGIVPGVACSACDLASMHCPAARHALCTRQICELLCMPSVLALTVFRNHNQMKRRMIEAVHAQRSISKQGVPGLFPHE